MFPGPLAYSLLGKALKAGLWQYHTYPLRDYALDKHHTLDDTPLYGDGIPPYLARWRYRIDDTPYGGGRGMVMRADVVGAALRALPRSISESIPGSIPGRRTVPTAP